METIRRILWLKYDEGGLCRRRLVRRRLLVALLSLAAAKLVLMYAGERAWTVVEGDTLGWIAHREYGETRLWRRIADANRLGAVRRLVPGTVLVIPNA